MDPVPLPRRRGQWKQLPEKRTALDGGEWME